ncbi:MAG: DUF3592 domain-containing protein [Anaerolineales bacterium]
MNHFNFTDLFAIFMILGTLGFAAILTNFFLYRMVIDAQNKEKAVMQWPSVTGTVVKSEVGIHKTSESHTEYPDVTYTYEVMGKAYRCKQILPGGDISGVNVQSTLNRYPLNAQITVYYDPHNPKDAVLERGSKKISKMLWFMLIGMNAFICFMAISMTRGVLK